MSRFHIAHIIPNPRWHGLNGYAEVIETVVWGLERLGHRVTYRVNDFETDATNIIFGAQVLPVEFQKQLSKDTIVYNFEQIRNLSPGEIKPEIRHCAENFRVWDYSQGNLGAWTTLAPKHEVKTVPIGFASFLARIAKPDLQDIDVLIYGITGEERLQVFHQLSRSGLSTLFVSGLYGAARDELIARSKIVLNLNLHAFARIFEIVRVSYLLANSKAVVSDVVEDTFIEPDIRPVIRLAPVSGIADACLSLIGDEKGRVRLEEAGYLAIRQRDIVKILKEALD